VGPTIARAAREVSTRLGAPAALAERSTDVTGVATSAATTASAE